MKAGPYGGHHISRGVHRQTHTLCFTYSQILLRWWPTHRSTTHPHAHRNRQEGKVIRSMLLAFLMLLVLGGAITIIYVLATLGYLVIKAI